MQLHGEKFLAGHGIEKAVQAVDDQQLQILLFNQLPDLMNELAGREFRGIHLAKEEIFRSQHAS